MGAQPGATPHDAKVRPEARAQRPLRVALVLPSLMIGGAEHHVVKLCRALDRAAVEPVILLLRRELPRELGALLPADVPIAVAPVGRRDPRLVSWLAGELRRRQVDVAQSFLWYADAITAAATLLVPGVRLTCSERGDRSMDYHTAARRLYDRAITFRRAARLSANSRFGASLLVSLGAPPDRVGVIPNGVDASAIAAVTPAPVRAMLGWPVRAHLVGSTSRLVEGKGLDTLITAVSRTSGADVRAVLVGDGPLRPALERLTSRLGATGRVAFVGRQTPATAYLAACDSAAQLSSETEHCSNSILEAMACGKPVVATRVGGNPELVADGRTGLLVPAGDPDAVVAALTQLARNPAGAALLGEQGREAVTREHPMTAVAAAFTDLWRAASAGR